MIISDASTTLYPSDQLWFNKNIGIAAFKRNKLFGLFIDKIHTRRDTVWDALNIETLKESTIRFLDLLEA